MQERLPRCRKLEQRKEHDYRDIGVRVAPGAAIELPEQLSRWRECSRTVGRSSVSIRSRHLGVLPIGNSPCLATAVQIQDLTLVPLFR